MNPLRLEILNGEFSVCQLKGSPCLDWTADFLFLAKTDEELSLVCRAGQEPAGCMAIEPGWRAFRVAGPLDFGLVGILAGLADALAQAGISIFAVSTFNTDYILVRSASFTAARAALRAAGHLVLSADATDEAE